MNISIFFNGKPVAYIYDDSIYSYKGKQLGWLFNGWIYDLSDKCVFFSENASGGPCKPCKSVAPIKTVKQCKPIKSTREVKRVKPVKSYSWSYNSNESFFD